MLRLNAYQNYSDNDYKVKTQWTDLTTNAVSEEEGWFRRFHDRYHNEAVMLQTGLVGKSWADHLIFGLQYSHERADIQNANLMKIVFGGKFRKNRAWAPSLMYDKYNLFTRGLHLRLSARYDDVLTNNVDTVSRTYSWTGQWRQNSYQGEGVATLAEFYGRTFTGVANLDYRIADHHFFTLNDTYTNYHRHTTNNAANAAQQTAATFMRRVNIKNILGLSYQFVPVDAWNMEVFAKHYDTRVQGPVNTAASSSRAVYEEQTQGSHVLGYGAAATWFLLRRDLQLKASYEHTYRLPTDLELFGDGDYEEGDAALKSESSNNVNLSDKSLTWVTGLPDLSTLSTGWDDGYDGSYYLPVAAGTSFAGGSGSTGGGNKGGWTRAASSFTPTIYRIDANTAVATPFMTFTSADLLKSIMILK